MVEPRSKLRKITRAHSSEFLNYRLTDMISLDDIINAGSFGEIYLGVCHESNLQFAVKVEKIRPEKKCKGLKREQDIVDQVMGRGQFPYSRYLAPHENYLKKEVLIMEKLGPNMG